MSEILQPADWLKPRGYANGIAAQGRYVTVAGQIGWDGQQHFAGDDFLSQAAQALRNIVAVLKEAGATPEHLVRMTWYVLDKREYLAAGHALGKFYKEIIGTHYPAMTLIEVSALLEDRALVEIEATAVVP